MSEPCRLLKPQTQGCSLQVRAAAPTLAVIDGFFQCLVLMHRASFNKLWMVWGRIQSPGGCHVLGSCASLHNLGISEMSQVMLGSAYEHRGTHTHRHRDRQTQLLSALFSARGRYLGQLLPKPQGPQPKKTISPDGTNLKMLPL